MDEAERRKIVLHHLGRTLVPLTKAQFDIDRLETVRLAAEIDGQDAEEFVAELWSRTEDARLAAVELVARALDLDRKQATRLGKKAFEWAVKKARRWQEQEKEWRDREKREQEMADEGDDIEDDTDIQDDEDNGNND